MLKFNKKEVHNNLNKRGYYIFHNFFDIAFCNSVIDIIDNRNITDACEKYYDNTETRIWDLDLDDIHVKQFCDVANSLVFSLFAKYKRMLKLLAIRNLKLDDPSKNSKGRWHIDSFRHQVKVFLFLNDTNDNNGPFELIPDTDSILFKIRTLLSGHYFSIKDIFTGNRKYQNLDDRFIDNLSVTHKPTPIICKAGTLVLVNTSMIHRARPCLSGNRYALTAYY